MGGRNRFGNGYGTNGLGYLPYAFNGGYYGGGYYGGGYYGGGYYGGGYLGGGDYGGGYYGGSRGSAIAYGHNPYDSGVPIAVGIRPPPVQPPAIYVIGAKSRHVRSLRGASRRHADGAVISDSRDADGASGVVGRGPQVIRISRSR